MKCKPRSRGNLIAWCRPCTAIIVVLLANCTQRQASKTVCPSGLRGWTRVPLAQAAWVQIPQLSSCALPRLPCLKYIFSGVACHGLSRQHPESTSSAIRAARARLQRHGAAIGPDKHRHETWTHWGLNPGPSACEADVIPLHHVPVKRIFAVHVYSICIRPCF